MFTVSLVEKKLSKYEEKYQLIFCAYGICVLNNLPHHLGLNAPKLINLNCDLTSYFNSN